MSASLKPPPQSTRSILRMHSEKTAEAQLESNPLLKKNNMGHFFCVVCQVQIKTHALWLAHAAKASHKQALIKFKEAKTGTSAPQASNQSDGKISAKPASTASLHSAPPSTTAPSKVSLLVGYDDDEDDEEAPKEQTEIVASVSIESQKQTTKDLSNPTSAAPAPPQSAIQLKKDSKEGEKKTESALPKGFFDDQKTDYKMRGEKLPEEEFEDDWKEFNKDISTDLMIADIVQNQEDLVDQEKRNFELDLQQFEQEQKVEEIKTKTSDLKKRLEQLRQTQQKNKREEIVTQEDALPESVLLDWRAKKIKSSSS